MEYGQIFSRSEWQWVTVSGFDFSRRFSELTLGGDRSGCWRWGRGHSYKGCGLKTFPDLKFLTSKLYWTDLYLPIFLYARDCQELNMKLNFNIKSGAQYCMTARLARHSVRELRVWDDGWTSSSYRTADFEILSFLQEGLPRRMTKTRWIRLGCHQDSRQPWKFISVSQDRWLPCLPHFGGLERSWNCSQQITSITGGCFHRYDDRTKQQRTGGAEWDGLAHCVC